MKKETPERPYRVAVEMLVELQRKLGSPLRSSQRQKLNKYVNQLVEESGLSGHVNERYFRLLATCALLNLEPMYRYWSAS